MPVFGTHFMRFDSGQPRLLVLVSDDNKRPTEFIERYCSRHRHFGRIQRQLRGGFGGFSFDFLPRTRKLLDADICQLVPSEIPERSPNETYS